MTEEKTKAGSIGDESGVQRNCFTPGIRDDDVLGAGCQAGRHNQQSVHVLEGDAGGFSIDGNCGTAKKTAASDSERSAGGCANGGRRNGADSQRNGGELNHGQGGVLRGAIRGSDGEEPLAIFVGGEEAAMKAVDIGHELLRKKNAQTQSAGMRVENVDAALDSRASGS